MGIVGESGKDSAPSREALGSTIRDTETLQEKRKGERKNDTPGGVIGMEKRSVVSLRGRDAGRPSALWQKAS